MDIEFELKKFKKSFDKELKKFLDLKTKKAKSISPEAFGMMKSLKGYIMNGGKRIRPALMYYTYLALGGKNKQEALRIGMALEFVHTFLLIHDDIIDKDNLRRGKPSVHYTYKILAEKNHYNNSADHYGNSQAISIGDMCFGFTGEIIASSKFSGVVKNRLAKKVSDIVFNTTIGQFHDVLAASTDNGITAKDVLTTLEYKTARYTVEGPLHLGAALAGSSERVLEKLTKFAIPLGVAFQIHDDILGVFGTSEETGKPVGADIREGKKTLLTVKALEMGDDRQKKELKSFLGNSEISAEDIEKARNIIIKTGSLEYSKKFAKKLVEKSYKALEKSKFSKESERFFTQVADYIIKRNY